MRAPNFRSRHWHTLCAIVALGVVACSGLDEQYVGAPAGDGTSGNAAHGGVGALGGSGGTGGVAGGGGEGVPETYRTAEQLYDELGQLASDHADIAELIDYGDSWQRWNGGPEAGHDLMALHVTAKAVAGPKPPVVIVAGYHGDEVIGPDVARRMAHWLVEGYQMDANATMLVDHHDTWIIPTINPDVLGRQRENANGVDLNRNHSFKWFPLPFHGDARASEPEIFHVEELLAGVLEAQRGPADADAAPLDTTGIYLTLHAAHSKVLWSWAWSFLPAPNADGLSAIGGKLAATLDYVPGQSSRTLYGMLGCASDWIYGTFGVPAMLIEIGFLCRPPFALVGELLWPAQRQALSYAGRIARAPYRLSAGPDVSGVSYDHLGDEIRLSAVVDDTANGGETIAGAELYVEVPYWQTGAQAIALTAADGQLDSPLEIVTTIIDVDTLPGGPLKRHMVFVRGIDAAGNWRPPGAAFVEPGQ